MAVRWEATVLVQDEGRECPICPSGVAPARPAILVVFHPRLAPLVGQTLPPVPVTGHAMVVVQISTDINLSGRFRHDRCGQTVGCGCHRI